MDSIKKHLADSKTSYTEHLRFAVYAGILLFYAAFASIVHAVIPSLFPSTAARIVSKLYNQRLKNHPNPDYRKIINE
jgi:hypothetical protein